MKLLSFRYGARESYGALTDDGIVDLGPRLGGRFPSLREACAPEGLAAIADSLQDVRPSLRLDAATFLPVIPRPARIFGIGVNYRDHAQETGRAETPHPSVFIRLPDSVVGHNEAILRPKVSTQLDFEGELAVIIGRAGRHIPPERALDHVAGYSCFNDASIRDWQRHNPGPTPGKNFYRCGALGPWLVTADEAGDPSQLTLTTHLNGAQVQHTTTDLMINDIPTIIAYISGFSPLEPGDVIATGTPAGVGHGRTPPLWMQPGDVVELTISGIGTLRNTIEDEA